MSPFVYIDLIPGYYPGRIITWKLDPTFKEKLPYIFTLEMSEDPNFSEIIVSKEVGDSFFAVDDTRTVQSFVIRVLYRVKLQTGDGVYYSPTIFFDSRREEGRKYLYAAEIVRKERLRAFHGGSTGWLLKKKNYSALVADELDPVSGVPISDNSTSFGTRFQGGFYPGLNVTYTIEDHDDNVQMSQDGSGVTHDKTATFRLVGFPSVETHDILVTKDSVRYNINKVKTRVFPGTNIVLVQNCAGIAVPPTDPIYSIEIA